mmetsp:Transcript_39758/g.119521  ORF Transcript_39758/g.119521 Transcript_39758/m.119521 type:complete len:1009 (-) Transcript_39758:406-3432(-)
MPTEDGVVVSGEEEAAPKCETEAAERESGPETGPLSPDDERSKSTDPEAPKEEGADATGSTEPEGTVAEADADADAVGADAASADVGGGRSGGVGVGVGVGGPPDSDVPTAAPYRRSRGDLLDPSRVCAPHRHDVLCGRTGVGSASHPGNVTFRGMVNERRCMYEYMSPRERPKMRQWIVSRVRAQHPPGRFLAKDGGTDLWYNVGDARAAEFTRKALKSPPEKVGGKRGRKPPRQGSDSTAVPPPPAEVPATDPADANIKTPGDRDVLCGWGAAYSQLCQRGNDRFRALVRECHPFHFARDAARRTEVVREVVRCWREERSPDGTPGPGRFLNKNVQTGMWYEIGDRRARVETDRVLREEFEGSPGGGSAAPLPLKRGGDGPPAREEETADGRAKGGGDGGNGASAGKHITGAGAAAPKDSFPAAPLPRAKKRRRGRPRKGERPPVRAGDDAPDPPAGPSAEEEERGNAAGASGGGDPPATTRPIEEGVAAAAAASALASPREEEETGEDLVAAEDSPGRTLTFTLARPGLGFPWGVALGMGPFRGWTTGKVFAAKVIPPDFIAANFKSADLWLRDGDEIVGLLPTAAEIDDVPVRREMFRDDGRSWYRYCAAAFSYGTSLRVEVRRAEGEGGPTSESSNPAEIGPTAIAEIGDDPGRRAEDARVKDTAQAGEGEVSAVVQRKKRTTQDTFIDAAAATVQREKRILQVAFVDADASGDAAQAGEGAAEAGAEVETEAEVSVVVRPKKRTLRDVFIEGMIACEEGVTRKRFRLSLDKTRQKALDRRVQGLVALAADMIELRARRGEYLEEKRDELMTDCLDILKQVRARTASKLKVDIKEVKKRGRPPPDPLEIQSKEMAERLKHLESLGYSTSDFFLQRLAEIPMYLNVKTSMYKVDKGMEVSIPKRMTSAMSYKLDLQSKCFPFTDVGFLGALAWRDEQIRKYEEDTGRDARAEMAKIKAKLDQQPRHPFLGGFIKKKDEFTAMENYTRTKHRLCANSPGPGKCDS